jgi:uncharacterized protein (TIGR00369 family)
MSTPHPRKILSGLEYMQRIAAGEINGAPMVRLLGMRLSEIEAGRVVVIGELKPEFENGLQIAHGGYAATMLDTALGCAINTVMPVGKIFTTLEMKLNYVRPITQKSGVLSCVATVIHAGSKTATAEGKITDGEGRLCAHGTATCILFRDLTGETT